MADFPRMADPTVRAPVVKQLHAVAARRGAVLRQPRFPATLRQVLAVDGSFFAVAADVAWPCATAPTRASGARASGRLIFLFAVIPSSHSAAASRRL
ncbi:MAG: hypothetical protein HYZ50_23385 [Deltaproteobacteria bacterium]|nr:hypothetical protein [Deltaproteobacteria bacterium]